MMKVSFCRFRSFGEQQSANVQRLTLVLGENSSGKSSFLSGLRYLYDFFAGREAPSFNRDPFLLGGFSNIAHYRGGRGGRALDFEIALSDKVPKRSRPDEPELPLEDKLPESDVEVKITFRAVDGEARPYRYAAQYRSAKFVFSADPDVRTSLSFADKEGTKTVELDPKRTPFSPTQPTARYIEFVLRDLVTGPTSRSMSEELPSTGGRQMMELARALSMLLNRMRHGVTALAPVRTRPRRTYDPTVLEQSSEGDDLIRKMAQMSRLQPAQWARAKEQLEQFGRETQLFETIKIKKFGNGDSDPFQVLVRTKGMDANIIDVGYGVSQALPLFVLLDQAGRETLLIQQPEVHLHPVAQAAIGNVVVGAANKRNGPSIVVETHSDYLLNRVMRLVKQKRIDRENLSVLFFHKEDGSSTIHELQVSEDGTFIDPPDAYTQFFVTESIRNMGYDV